MKNYSLYDLFVEELTNIYDAEHQLLNYFPQLIKLTSLTELKEILSSYLKNTEDQVKNIEKIFSILTLTPKSKECFGMKGLLKEADEIVDSKNKSACLDAAIICAIQKVKHYEIAAYGTLRAFASQLDLDSEIENLLEESLEDEESEDNELTKIAEGSFFKEGVNEQALGTIYGKKHLKTEE